MDKSTFQQIYDEHGRAVYNFVLWLTVDRGVADDIVQDVFIKVWRSTPDTMGAKVARSWLLTVARNAAMDYFRAKRRRRDLTERFCAETDDFVHPQHEKQLWSSLSVLNEEDRGIVYLHFKEGYTYAEIAKMIKLSEGNVRIKAFRAFGRLRSSMVKDQS